MQYEVKAATERNTRCYVQLGRQSIAMSVTLHSVEKKAFLLQNSAEIGFFLD